MLFFVSCVCHRILNQYYWRVWFGIRFDLHNFVYNFIRLLIASKNRDTLCFVVLHILHIGFCVTRVLFYVCTAISLSHSPWLSIQSVLSSISFRSTLSKFAQSTHSDNIYSAPCTTTIIFTFITLLCIVYMFFPSTLCLSAWQQRDEKWMNSVCTRNRTYNESASVLRGVCKSKTIDTIKKNCGSLFFRSQ